MSNSFRRLIMSFTGATSRGVALPVVLAIAFSSPLLSQVPTRTSRITAPNLLNAIPDSIRQKHMVHVSPNLVVFDPDTRSTTLEFSNTGDQPIEADVVTQLGYTYWQNTDTAFAPTPGKTLRAHDTVVFHPTAADHYAGTWISGLPTHVALKPHETRSVTISINPPGSIPDGEYFARIVTTVSRPKRTPVSADQKVPRAFPVKGWDLPLIRDSVRVFYRKGPQTAGFKIVRAEAKIDTASAPIEDVGPHPLRLLFDVRKTGNAHVEAQMEMSFVNEDGDEIPLTGSEGGIFSLYRDGIMRWSAETDHLPPGSYHVVIRFFEHQAEFSAAQRIRMDPVTVELPFTVPDYATGVYAYPAVNTGQDIVGNERDPYWTYIRGRVDYTSAGALAITGQPAVAMSRAHMWGSIRTTQFEKNRNLGFVGYNDGGDCEVGHTTMRLFVDMSRDKLRGLARMKLPVLAGHAWVGDCLARIYINGRPLKNIGVGFDPDQKPLTCPSDAGWSFGYVFHIDEDDGIVEGMNVLDFVITEPDESGHGLRVDFRSIYRETYDK